MTGHLLGVDRSKILNGCLAVVLIAGLTYQYFPEAATISIVATIICTLISLASVCMKIYENRALPAAIADAQKPQPEPVNERPIAIFNSGAGNINDLEIAYYFDKPRNRDAELDTYAESWIRDVSLGHDRSFDRPMAPNTLVFLEEINARESQEIIKRQVAKDRRRKPIVHIRNSDFRRSYNNEKIIDTTLMNGA